MRRPAIGCARTSSSALIFALREFVAAGRFGLVEPHDMPAWPAARRKLQLKPPSMPCASRAWVLIKQKPQHHGSFETRPPALITCFLPSMGQSTPMAWLLAPGTLPVTGRHRRAKDGKICLHTRCQAKKTQSSKRGLLDS